MSTSLKSLTSLNKAIGSYIIPGLVVFVTFICVFTPTSLFFRQVSDYTFFIMLGLMVMGFAAFLLKHDRIMLFSLLCCCILCLHLKGSANQQMRLSPVTANPSLKISHISLGNAENDYDLVIDYLLQVDADFISFQELTPDWNEELTKRLSSKFTYITTMTRLDQYGMGFFSKIPFHSLDTLYFEGVPNLISSINLGDNHTCHIVSCQVVPPVNQAAFSMISRHFHYLTGYMKNLDGDVIVIGDLHLPQWAAEILQFKTEAKLLDSRRDTNPRNQDGSMSLPRIPVEHIFYGDQFECTSFSELGNNIVGRIGIIGTYQTHYKDAENIR